MRQFTTPEQTAKLIELGFEPKQVPATCGWLREEKGYYVYPFFDNEYSKWTWVCRERTGDMWIPLVDFEEKLFDTYELAFEEALAYSLKNLV